MKRTQFLPMLMCAIMAIFASTQMTAAPTLKVNASQTMFAHFDADQPCDIANATTGCYAVFHFKIATSQDDRGAAFQNMANVQDNGDSGGGYLTTQRTDQRGFDQDQGARVFKFLLKNGNNGGSAMVQSTGSFDDDAGFKICNAAFANTSDGDYDSGQSWCTENNVDFDGDGDYDDGANWTQQADFDGSSGANWQINSTAHGDYDGSSGS